MSEEIVTQQLEQDLEQNNGDSCVDAMAAMATVCLFVVAVIFWISNQ